MAEKVENIDQSPGQSSGKSFGLSGIGSLISGGVSALDSIFGWSSKRQEKAQQRLMDKQQEQWKEQQQILADQMLAQWNRENEYNDPTNYYQRLFDAAEKHGINPNLLVQGGLSGSVGQSATGVSVPGSTSVPGVGGVTQQSIGGSMNTVLAGLRQRAEIDNIDALTQKYKADAGTAQSQTKVNDANAVYLQELSNLTASKVLTDAEDRACKSITKILMQYQADRFNEVTDAELAHQYAEISNLNVNTRKQEIDNITLHSRNQAILEQTQSQAELNIAMQLVQKVLANKYGAEYVYQLAQNEHWNRTVDDIETQIKNGTFRSAFGSGLFGDAVGTSASISASVISVVCDILGITHKKYFEKSTIGRIFASLFNNVEYASGN